MISNMTNSEISLSILIIEGHQSKELAGVRTFASRIALDNYYPDLNILGYGEVSPSMSSKSQLPVPRKNETSSSSYY